MKTRITELFGVDYPIIQGGMMWVSRAELVAAVSNAGGLGILSALTFPSPEELAAEIKRTRELTDKTFGVNITLLPTLRPKDIDGYFDVVIKGGIKVVETAGRSPEPYMERLKVAGVKVIHKCTAVRFARKAERIGCDAVSIDGFECAGFPGEEDITSLILIPLTADALEIPVVASGGFGDGRGLVAALALGAEGVNMGTRFMATQESPIHARVKEWLVQASERDTVLLLRSLRNTERILRNPAAEKILEMEKQGATLEELAPFITGKEGEKLLETGDLDKGLLGVGQVVGLIHDIPTVKQLIDGIVHEAEEVASHLGAEGVFKPVRKPSAPSA
ncbi:MAG: nitronate monooxygenase [Dehalococcoidia bacterium]|nr:MAG: nitronate monooxygenase [Dehalococcoidia bacterium]